MARRDRNRSTGRDRFGSGFQLGLVLALTLVIGVLGGVNLSGRLTASRQPAPPPAATVAGTAATAGPSTTPTDPTTAATGRRATTIQPDQSPTSGTAQTSRPMTGPALKRRDTTPVGVEGYMSSFFGGADLRSPCEGDRPSPEIDVSSRVGLGELHELCLWGFPAGKTVEVQIRAPDGRVERRDVCYWCREASNSVLWGSTPGDPLGTYRVTVTQGATELTADFVLQQQRAPLLRVVGSVAENGRANPIRAGTTVGVVLAGFPASSSVRLDVYFAPGAPVEAKYITTLPVRTDGDGQRLYELGTARGEEGCYVLRTRPPVDFHAVDGVADSIETFCLA